MYTHRDAIESFKHFALDKSGYVTDDSSWSDKAILRALQEGRSTVIDAALASSREVSEYCVQTLGCVDLIEVDRAECTCAPASGCYWLKTTVSVPHPIKISSVTGTVAGVETPRFQYLKWDRFQYIPTSRNPSTQHGMFWSIKNVRDKEYLIYLYGNRFLQTAAITGIFEDPILAAQFPSCGQENTTAKCNPFDVDFYTDSWMRDQINTLAWQKLIPIRQAAETDIINNDRKDQPSS